MSFGEQCNKCGKCCLAIPCGISLAFFGSHGGCEALEQNPDGTYVCGLVEHASKYLDLGIEAAWKDEFLTNLFSHMLGVGMGCCSSPEGEVLTNKLRSKLVALRNHLNSSPESQLPADL
jgi:hypothetical protein